MIDTPQFAFPFEIGERDVAVVEQGSADEIAAAVEAILRYPMGSRPEAPRFGRPRGLNFSKGELPREEIVAQLELFEPRVSYLVEEDPQLLDQVIRRVSVHMKGATT